VCIILRKGDMDQPIVSVILPVFNGEQYLTQTLQSVFEQDYSPFEVIVVDDGSTDNSASIVRSFRDVMYIYQPNQGVAVARNTGLAAGRGEFIAFIDQDDLWMPKKLSVQMDYMLKHPDVYYVLSKQKMFLEPGCHLPGWLKKEFLKEEQAGFLPSTLLCRKSVFELTGKFDPAYTAASDTDWFFRAKDAGITMATIPEVLVKRRIHGRNQSYQAEIINRELLRISLASIRRQRSQKT